MAATIEAQLCTTRDELLAVCRAHRGQVLAALTFDAAAIADAAGFEVLLRIVNRWGGCQVSVPGSRAGTQLAREIGEAAARRLSERLGYGRLEVPSVSGVVRALRPFFVMRMRRAGRSSSQIAVMLGITERHVRRELARYRRMVGGEAT